MAAGDIQKGLVDGKRLHERGEVVHDAQKPAGEVDIKVVLGLDKKALRAELSRLSQNHAGLDALSLSLVACRQDDSAPLLRIPNHHHRLPLQLRVQRLVHACEKGIHISQEDRPLHATHSKQMFDYIIFQTPVL